MATPNVHVKKWPRKNLGELVNFLESQSPDGLSLQILADKLGVTRGSISNIFCHDNMKLSKAEEIARIFGYELRLFFPERKHLDGYIPAPPKKTYPNAGNLSGFVKYVQDSEYSLTFVAEHNGYGTNVIKRAFESGDISIATLNSIMDNMGLCMIWKFEKIS